MPGTDDITTLLTELVTFVRVAEAGSFSAAARRWQRTPSALSRQVARLERELGVQLLRRTTRELRLTDAGLDVLERGREMVQAARAGLQAAEGHMQAPQGRLRLSAPKAYARQVLWPHLLRFMHDHPAIDLHLMVIDRAVDAVRENVDIVVRLTSDPPQGLVARALKPVQQWIVASPSYLADHAPITHPSELMAHSCITLGEQEGDHRWRFERDDESADVLVTGRLAVNHSEMRRDAIEAGYGVGCLPDFAAAEGLASGRLVRVLPEWQMAANYQGTAYLMFAPSRYHTPKVRVLVDHLLAALAP